MSVLPGSVWHGPGRLCQRAALSNSFLIKKTSVIHRADYLNILLEEALRLGLVLRKGCEVSQILFEDAPKAVLKDGEIVSGDVIVGADGRSGHKMFPESPVFSGLTNSLLEGLWSATRDQILGHSSPPQETGDLAFRGTFALERLQALKKPGMDELIRDTKAHLWMGPDKHCSFYPVRNGQEFNLVLL